MTVETKPTPSAVEVISAAAPFADQEALYLAVRAREGRLYPDADLRQLPRLPAEHPLHAEWAVRRRSFERLRRYLGRKGAGLRILDLGCGNGWLAHGLAQAGHTVYAVDLNRLELEQAARVFGTEEKLHFFYADVFDQRLPLAGLDVVVIAAAVQYFPDLSALIGRLFELLAPGGEVHLLDTYFYTAHTVAAARDRTRAYYVGLGFGAMAPFYHHHIVEELSNFNYRQRNLWWYSGRLGRMLTRTPSFPWYVITKPGP